MSEEALPEEVLPEEVLPEEVLGVDGISVSRSGRRVLDEVRFSIRAGELTGLIGSNGAGKTTLLRAVLGLQPVTAGRVLVAGRRRSRRGRLIGYVPQKTVLDPDVPMRARDVVALGLEGHRLGMPLPNAQRRLLVDRMLRAVGAQEFADARVGHLSGGEQQRVLIAHALVSGPKLLLMDEPLANLDLRSEQEVVDLLARIATEQRIAVLISAHDMNPLLPVTDRIVYLADGRAVSGRVDEVVRSEVLSGLYRHPVEVLRVHGRVLVLSGPAASTPATSADEDEGVRS